MAVQDWSTTASSNNAAPPNGAPEGQTPGSVNNCIREVMASVRSFYDNAALKDATNILTATWSGLTTGPAIVSSARPSILHTETDAAADEKNWLWDYQAGQLNAYLGNDSGSFSNKWLTVDRTGASVSTINLQATEVQINGAAITSGTYTPTLANTTNVSSSTARVCQYIRVGSVVTVSGTVNVTTTSGGGNTVLGMSLPIASDLTVVSQLGGAGGTVSAGANTPMWTQGDTTNNRAIWNWISFSPAGAAEYGFTFTYVVI